MARVRALDSASAWRSHPGCGSGSGSSGNGTGGVFGAALGVGARASGDCGGNADGNGARSRMSWMQPVTSARNVPRSQNS